MRLRLSLNSSSAAVSCTWLDCSLSRLEMTCRMFFTRWWISRVFKTPGCQSCRGWRQRRRVATLTSSVELCELLEVPLQVHLGKEAARALEKSCGIETADGQRSVCCPRKGAPGVHASTAQLWPDLKLLGL